MFVTTHYMLEAEYCDRISIMKTGDVVAMGSPEELKEGGKTLEDVFISLVKRGAE